MKRFWSLLLFMFLLSGCSSISKIVEDEFSEPQQDDILKNTAAEYIVDRSVGGEAGKILQTEMNLLKNRIQEALQEKALVRQPDEGILIVFNSDNIFKSGRSQIREDFKKDLIDLSEILQGMDHLKIYVLVHTDNNASNYVSLSLTEKRASILRKELAKNGIQKKKIHAEGKGSLVPVISNESEDGRRLNRRVEIAIVADHSLIRYVQKSVKKKK